MSQLKGLLAAGTCSPAAVTFGDCSEYHLVCYYETGLSSALLLPTLY